MKDILNENTILCGFLDHIYTNAPQFIHQDTINNKNQWFMITTILVVRTSSNPKPTVRRQLEVMNLKDLKKEEIKEMCNNMDHSDF